jgi:hypothetical protein
VSTKKQKRVAHQLRLTNLGLLLNNIQYIDKLGDKNETNERSREGESGKRETRPNSKTKLILFFQMRLPFSSMCPLRWSPSAGDNKMLFEFVLGPLGISFCNSKK